MIRSEVRKRIEEIGILPGIRVNSQKHALFAAEAVYQAGIPIAEVTMTVPGAIDVIAHLARAIPSMIVGAGTVLDADTARRCLDAGAKFITSTGLVMEVAEIALKSDVVFFPGALTPTEIIAGWKAGSDFVKIFPCAQVGGHSYLRALKGPFPQIKLIASGGVNQQTAFDFILGGATALGIGAELIPPEDLQARRAGRIQELARRFLGMVKAAREQLQGGA